MTFIVGAAVGDAIWLCADRRLRGHVNHDRAVKIFSLETPDGRAFIGYAGIGWAVRGEISGWLYRALTGVKGPQELVLQHVMKIAGITLRGLALRHGHLFMAVGTVNGKGRMYHMDVVRRRTDQYLSRRSKDALVGYEGSGANYVEKERRRLFKLRRSLKLYDHGKLSPRAVAQELAELNRAVSLRSTDKSVSPNCLVAWSDKNRGGAHWGFDDYARGVDGADGLVLPAVGNGFPITDMVELAKENAIRAIRQGFRRGGPKPFWSPEFMQQIANIKDMPDNKL